MIKRKSLSKKIRFEVFKRDSFTCQYCGKSAPNIVLEIDHIEPVSKGGSNNLLNLITSCYECNRGKSNIELDDESIVSKQRSQLKLLQERREQIQLMFNWKKELDNLKNDTADMVIDYIENKLDNFSLNESCEKKISLITKKFELADILEAIDLSAAKYLRYDNDGDITHDSADDFINKISGILVNKNKPPIDQRVSYIKGICRNRFNYWNPQKGSIILNNYIKALRDYGWSDNSIIEDIENEVIPKTKKVRNWTEWRNLIEKWTEDIKGWERCESEISPSCDITKDELDSSIKDLLNDREGILPALIHIGSVFEKFEKEVLLEKIDISLLTFLSELEKYYSTPEDNQGPKPSYFKIARKNGLLSMFEPINNTLTFHLNTAVTSIISDFFEHIGEYNIESSDPEDFNYIKNQYLNLIKTKN